MAQSKLISQNLQILLPTLLILKIFGINSGEIGFSIVFCDDNGAVDFEQVISKVGTGYESFLFEIDDG